MPVTDTIKQYPPEKHNLLQILHALQDEHPENYLTPEALSETARYLNITKAQIYGVAGYYTMFSLKPRGRQIIRVCVSPVCEMVKSQVIVDELKKQLHVDVGETTKDKLFTLELSECLGQCQEAPTMMINQKVYNNLNPEKIREIIESYRK
ncbi:MAG: NAD(P)H-dependent oxidoreductase subunit E [Bacteroidales bacterium]